MNDATKTTKMQARNSNKRTPHFVPQAWQWEPESLLTEHAVDGVRAVPRYELIQVTEEDALAELGCRAAIRRANAPPGAFQADRDAATVAIYDPKDGGITLGVPLAIAEQDEAHGYTFAGWLAAAGRSDSASEHDLRAAWRAGEDPKSYA